MNSCDRRFMALALEQAEEAARAGEVPVGAVAVVGGKAVVSARNRVEERGSATAHAELELLHKLELLRGDWRMEDVTVYVTKEPCPMCAGALVNARVRRIVYGAADPRFGGCSVFGIPAHPGSLWKPEVTPEICAAEARNLLAAFFREARSAGRELPVRMRNGFDPEYAVQLNALMREVFDFDFDFWFRRGMWSDKYESFSLIDAGRMVAHVGVSRMKLRVKGKEFFAIQLGGVATSPEARGQGHMRRLLGGLLRRYAETPVFLFANDSVSDFYPKFGFSAARTMRPVARLSIDNPFEPERCTPDAAAPLAGKRRFPSAVFDVLDCRELRCFHLFGGYADRLLRLGPGLAVAAEQCGDTLLLHELLCDRPVDWETLAARLPFRNIRRVEFGFPPDRLGVEFGWEAPPEPEHLFLRGGWDLPENFCIPAFAVT